MKKFIAIVLTIALCLSLTQCVVVGKPSNTPSKETPESSVASSSVESESSNISSSVESENSEELTFGLNETAAFDNLKFTATEIKESNGVEFFEPESGKVFVGIKFTIENISDEEQNISSFMQFTPYVDDIKSEYSISASCAFDDGTLDGKIAKGKKLVGWYTLEVPKDWSTINIEVVPDWPSTNTASFVFENN